jgi:hypothetical protein
VSSAKLRSSKRGREEAQPHGDGKDLEGETAATIVNGTVGPPYPPRLL